MTSPLNVRRTPLLFALGLFGVAAAQGPPVVSTPDEPSEPAFVQVSEHVYRMGDIRLNKKERTVRFPAKINMRENTVEYFCVTETGRTHESVLSTKISPAKLHIAVLLLGRPGEIKPPMSIEQSEIQKGCPVDISINWKNKNGVRKAKASEWIVHTRRKKALPVDFWEYTSSRMREDVFLAERDGSVVAIMGDVNSMINIRDEDRKYDDVWIANAEVIPEVGTPVEVILTLKPVKGKNGKETSAVPGGKTEAPAGRPGTEGEDN